MQQRSTATIYRGTKEDVIVTCFSWMEREKKNKAYRFWKVLVPSTVNGAEPAVLLPHQHTSAPCPCSSLQSKIRAHKLPFFSFRLDLSAPSPTLSATPGPSRGAHDGLGGAVPDGGVVPGRGGPLRAGRAAPRRLRLQLRRRGGREAGPPPRLRHRLGRRALGHLHRRHRHVQVRKKASAAASIRWDLGGGCLAANFSFEEEAEHSSRAEPSATPPSACASIRSAAASRRDPIRRGACLNFFLDDLNEGVQ